MFMQMDKQGHTDLPKDEWVSGREQWLLLSFCLSFSFTDHAYGPDMHLPFWTDKLLLGFVICFWFCFFHTFFLLFGCFFWESEGEGEGTLPCLKDISMKSNREFQCKQNGFGATSSISQKLLIIFTWSNIYPRTEKRWKGKKKIKTKWKDNHKISNTFLLPPNKLML